MSGTLPPQWSTLDLNTLNLDRNALTGESCIIQRAYGCKSTQRPVSALNCSLMDMNTLKYSPYPSGTAPWLPCTHQASLWP